MGHRSSPAAPPPPTSFTELCVKSSSFQLATAHHSSSNCWNMNTPWQHQSTHIYIHTISWQVHHTHIPTRHQSTRIILTVTQHWWQHQRTHDGYSHNMTTSKHILTVITLHHDKINNTHIHSHTQHDNIKAQGCPIYTHTQSHNNHDNIKAPPRTFVLTQHHDRNQGAHKSQQT